MRILDDSAACPNEDAANIMLCLHKDPWVSGAEHRDGRVTWSLWADCPRGEEMCRHGVLRERVGRVVSTHRPEAW